LSIDLAMVDGYWQLFMFHVTYHNRAAVASQPERSRRSPSLSHRTRGKKMRPPVRKLRRSTLADDSYAAVRRTLVDEGHYTPGDKISIEELSRQLGVSRSPVWAAIARLAAEGIVEVRPRHGVFLVGFDPARLREAFQAREALEGMAARLAAKRISADQLAELRNAIKEQRASLAAQDVEGYAAATLKFHREVLRSAGNDTIEHLVVSIYARVKAMCAGLQVPLEQFRRNCEGHERLLAALRAGDADRAEREARAHARQLAASIARTERSHPSKGRRTAWTRG
jgi:DNA-binding GntR family transcriptional regulator